MTKERPATFYCITGGSDTGWRVEYPAKAIGAKEVLIPANAYQKREQDGKFGKKQPGGFWSVLNPNDHTELPWTFLVDRNDPDYWEIHFPENEGTAIWTRPDLTRATLAKAMREKCGIRTLAEVDDNYLGDSSLNIFTKSQKWTDNDRKQHLVAHSAMDGLITSTAWLRDHYAKEIRKTFRLSKRELPEMHVCRNNLPEEDWPARIEPEGRVRVGWMGSPSHVWDVDLMWAAMLRAHRLGAETWTIGYDPTDPWSAFHTPEDIRSAKAKDKVEQWRKVGAKNIKWVQPDKYQRLSLPLDIGLAPLRTDVFTLGKSDVKAIEYTVSGAACVLQNNLVYNRDWIHGETCLLAGSPQQFLEYTELLIRDSGLRERLVGAAQQYVREERGLKQLREEWGHAVNG